MKKEITTFVASARSTVAVFQTWEMGRTIGDCVRQAARRGEEDDLRRLTKLLRAESYVGSFELNEDHTLEELYVLLQNDSHPEGWVAALGAQESWRDTIGEGSACSLSMGDVLYIDAPGQPQRKFVVGMTGWIDLS